jgi:serine protease Do
MYTRRIVILSTALIGILAIGLSLQAQSPPPALRAEPLSFRDVVKSVLPAVVSIDAKASRNRLDGFRANDGEESSDLRKFFDGLEPKKPQGRRGDMTIGFGSGFIVDVKGIVMTNHHVVEHADSVEITLTDGRKFTSKDIKSDSRTDLAIIRFDPKGGKLTALELADSSLMEVGDRVLAIGAPFGLSGSVTSGIISAKGRDVGLNNYDDFLQTDAAINPGNSGGPLVNLDGKVIGVNSAIETSPGAKGFQGVSLAISSNMATSVMVPLIKDGVVRRAYIGIRTNTGPRDPDAPKPDMGVIVASVIAKAPADKGGIQAKDIIASINGKPIKEYRDLTKAIAGQPVGATIEIGIIRDGKPNKVKVVLEEEPKDFMNSKARPSRPLFGNGEVVMVNKAGLHLTTLTEDQAERLGVNQGGGALVHGVVNGSVADKAGITPGTIILKVNNKVIESAEDAKKEIEENLADDGATLQVQVGRKVSTVFLQAK